jgi:hypothetical protein
MGNEGLLGPIMHLCMLLLLCGINVISDYSDLTELNTKLINVINTSLNMTLLHEN